LNLKQEWVENAKKRAALKAVEHVEDTSIIGLGSGSTAAYAIEELGKRVQREQLHILAVPTSHQASMLAVKNRIQITTLDEHPTLDLTIDGADQIDHDLNLIKGMGGALTREKVVASASIKLIIIADDSKRVSVLGEKNHPVPLEVIQFAAASVTRKIEGIGGKPTLREGRGKVGPIISDNGNIIVDAYFGLIHEPAKLEALLKSIPGIVETGLFVEMADVIYVGTRSTVTKIEK
jgi:ribose 5-phosphate isomerase A